MSQHDQPRTGDTEERPAPAGWTPTRLSPPEPDVPAPGPGRPAPGPGVPPRAVPPGAVTPGPVTARSGVPYPRDAAPPAPPAPGRPAPAPGHPVAGSPAPGPYPPGAYPAPGSYPAGPAGPYAAAPYPAGPQPGTVPYPPYPGPGARYGFPAGPAARRGGTPRWVIAVVVAVAVLVGGSILTAIAAPVLLQQRAKAQWRATTVALPDAVLGMPRRSELESDRTLQTVLGTMPSGTQLGVYADDTGNGVVVIAYRAPAAQSDAAQQATWRGFEQAVRTSRTPALVLTDRDPGRLGGRLACGNAGTGTVCMATDPAATIAVASSGNVPVDAVASVRALVEQRAG